MKEKNKLIISSGYIYISLLLLTATGCLKLPSSGKNLLPEYQLIRGTVQYQLITSERVWSGKALLVIKPEKWVQFELIDPLGFTRMTGVLKKDKLVVLNLGQNCLLKWHFLKTRFLKMFGISFNGKELTAYLGRCPWPEQHELRKLKNSGQPEMFVEYYPLATSENHFKFVFHNTTSFSCRWLSRDFVADESVRKLKFKGIKPCSQ